MRKRNPNDVIDDFKDLLRASLADWQALCAQLQQNDLKKRATTDAFLNAAVGWEGFLSDWHIAAINRDSSAFAAHLTNQVEQKVRDAWAGLDGRVTVSLPKHPSLDIVRDILDPQGANVSLGPKDKWLSRVNNELCDPFKAKVLALPDADHALLAAVMGIRNCIAHRSHRATNTMNDALDQLALGDQPLRRGQSRVLPSGIGAHLYAVAGHVRRVERYHRRLDEIADRLRI